MHRKHYLHNNQGRYCLFYHHHHLSTPSEHIGRAGGVPTLTIVVALVLLIPDAYNVYKL